MSRTEKGIYILFFIELIVLAWGGRVSPWPLNIFFGFLFGVALYYGVATWDEIRKARRKK